MNKKQIALVFVTVFMVVGSLSYGYQEHRRALAFQHIYAPMKTIANQHFRNQIVPLDGNIYKECTFDDVTFRWHGEPYSFDRVHINGHRSVEVDGNVADVVYFLGALDLLRPDFNETLRKLR